MAIVIVLYLTLPVPVPVHRPVAVQAAAARFVPPVQIVLDDVVQQREGKLGPTGKTERSLRLPPFDEPDVDGVVLGSVRRFVGDSPPAGAWLVAHGFTGDAFRLPVVSPTQPGVTFSIALCFRAGCFS